MQQANSHQFTIHRNWFLQAVKDVKDYFFIAQDLEEEEEYPQFFEEKIEMDLEIKRLLDRNEIKVVAIYHVSDDFENQFRHQLHDDKINVDR